MLFVGLALIVIAIVLYAFRDTIVPAIEQAWENRNNDASTENLPGDDYEEDDIDIVADLSDDFDEDEWDDIGEPEETEAAADEDDESPQPETPAKAEPEGVYLEAFRENGKTGFRNKKDGSVAIPARYDIYLHYDERKPTTSLAVRLGKKYGVVDERGNTLLPFEYDKIEYCNVDDHWKVSRRVGEKMKFGMVRMRDAEVVIPVKYDYLNIIGPASFVAVGLDRQYGCVNDRDEVIVPLRYPNPPGVSRGGDGRNTVWFTGSDGNSVVYDKLGNEVEE